MRAPSLPQLLERKIYKTGQTRGADDDVIFQNRVGRNSTVLIPFNSWRNPFPHPTGETEFENGYIVLVSPDVYFQSPNIDSELSNRGLELGRNAVVFYETRAQWTNNNPDQLHWESAQNRVAPLGGKYVARVPGTTATNESEKIVRGFTTTRGKGAGIRVYEYANSATIKECRYQLEALFWLCYDSENVAADNGMNINDIRARKSANTDICLPKGLLDFERLVNARMINNDHKTVCPLCLEAFSAAGFFNRMQQAEGREVPDLTVTELNLFHVEELRIGMYNHRPYNLGWGHHHCNVVTKDTGISQTLRWMSEVIARNSNSSSS